MRVTAETKEATRQAIIEAARRLFIERGWDNVGTREIAAEAGVANGTLFNYFATKDAIAGTLVADALASATETPAEGTVEERLFALIAAGLRRLKPYRTFLPLVLPSILASDGRMRDEHLNRVDQIVGRTLPPMLRHLYWSLYSGVLSFWLSDRSAKQVETLAFLDQSMALFAASLNGTLKTGKEPAYER